MIRCCLCREQAHRGEAIGITLPSGEYEHVRFEPTDLPGTGYRCTDHDACRQRVRDIVAAHVGLGEVCAE